MKLTWSYVPILALTAMTALSDDELRIERFDLDFTKSDGYYTIEEWDNYEVPGSEGVWIIYARYNCPNCGHQNTGASIWPEVDRTNHVISVTTEIHCRECGYRIPLAKSYEEYEDSMVTVVTDGFTNHIATLGFAWHQSYTEQINFRFMISVPVDWVEDFVDWQEFSDPSRGVDIEQTNFAITVSQSADSDGVVLAGSSYACSAYEYLYNPDRSVYDKIKSPDTVIVHDITPDDYNRSRRLLCIRGTYWIRSRRGRSDDWSVLGQEIKRSFYRIMYIM